MILYKKIPSAFLIMCSLLNDETVELVVFSKVLAVVLFKISLVIKSDSEYVAVVFLEDVTAASVEFGLNGLLNVLKLNVKNKLMNIIYLNKR